MEKTLKYQNVILSLLEDYAVFLKPANMQNVENQIVADGRNHRYQLVRHGWNGYEYVHYIVFQFDIIDGKIWVQENRTDVDIDAELEELGVPRRDIASGLQHPSFRQNKERALAAA